MTQILALPPKPKKFGVNFRLTEKQDERLRSLCAALNRTPSELLGYLIEQAELPPAEKKSRA